MTRVAETRADEHAIMNRRRRICQECAACFWTYEVDDLIASQVMDAMKSHASAVIRRRAIGRRNRGIIDALLGGEKVGELAKRIGVSQATVSRIGNAAGIYSRGPYKSMGRGR